MSEVMLEYFVVSGVSLGDLQALVRDEIAIGWFPQGGVAVAGRGNNMIYLQAMMRIRSMEDYAEEGR